MSTPFKSESRLVASILLPRLIRAAKAARGRRAGVSSVVLGDGERLHNAVLDALEKVAPVVEEAAFGVSYADLTGMERLYPDPSLLLQSISGAVATVAADARVGAGPNKFVAHVAARQSAPLQAVAVPSAEAASFLSPLSIRFLWVSEEARRRLSLFGIAQMGQLASLDPVAVEAQLGSEGRRAWELAQGIDRGPVIARRPFRPIVESLRFASPVSEWPPFWAGLRELLALAWKRQERRGLTVRQLQIAARVDGDPWELGVTLHEPVGDRDRLEGMLRRRLEGVTLPGAVSELSLRLTLLGGAVAGQESLFVGHGERWKKIRDALASVKARRGSTGLYRILEVEPWSRIPERRYALISFEP